MEPSGPEDGLDMAPPRRAVLLGRVFPADRPAKTVGRFGGLPPLPDGVDWPRRRSTGRPMMFLAEIALDRLPSIEAAPALPSAGSLLAFICVEGDGGDGDPESQDPIAVVLHVASGAPERSPPADAPPCFGREWRHYLKSLAPDAAAPRSFPRWPIEAHVVDSHCEATFDWSPQAIAGNDRRLERARRLNAAAFAAAHGAEIAKRRYHDGPGVLPPEPYPEFWAVVAAAAGAIGFDDQFALHPRYGRVSQKARPTYEQAVAEARAWEEEARSRDPWEAPSADDRRRFRDWVAALAARTKITLQDYGKPSDDVFLVSTSTLPRSRDEALDRLAAEDPARLRAAAPGAEAEIAWRHTLVHDANGAVAVVGHQMLGWGIEIQGAVADHRDDILLLQLDSDEGIGWMWGDAGAIQFWISPDDLAARRFERMVVTADCH